MFVRDAWYVVCEAAELGSKPLQRTLFGTPLALFRGAGGEPVALVDRCAHRNVPISGGRVVHGEIECPYHGWRFDNAGACRAVPALIAEATGKGRKIPKHATRERQGMVWVYGIADAEPTTEPYVVPHLADARYGVVRYAQDFEGTLHAVAENILDVPHTAFLHRGLFRGSGKRNKIQAVVTRDATSVEAEYIGEPRPSGIAGRILAPQGGTVKHYDRFLLPSIAQVEYGLGDTSHIVITNLLTPIDETHTAMHSIITFRLPLASGVVGRILTPLAKRIVGQDVDILRLQSENIRRFGGERFVSTDVDLLGGHILRLLKQAERGEAGSAAGKTETVWLEV